jgi:two-component system sensor histidine kinase ComP
MISFKSKKKLYITICLALILFQGWVVFIALKYPYLGVSLAESENNTWYVSKFYKDGLAQKSGLAINDQLVKIDGQAAHFHPPAAKFHELEQTRSIEVLRDGISITFDFNNSEKYFPLRSVAVLAELLLFGVAAILAFKIKNSPAGSALIATFLLMGVAFMAAEASSRSDILSIIVVLTSMSLIPFTFALFIYYFLTQKGYRLYIGKRLQAVIIILTSTVFLRLIYFFDLPLYLIRIIDRTFTLICFTFGCLVVLSLLISTFRKNRLEYSFSALIVRIILQSFGMAFIPYLSLTIIPDLTGEAIVHHTKAVWFIILFPLSFIYFAVKYKLLEHAPFLRSLFGRNHYQVLSFNRLLAEYGRTNALNEWEKQLFPQFCKVLRLEAIGLRIVDQGNVRLYAHGPLDEEALVQAFADGRHTENGYQIYAIQSKFEFNSQLIIKRSLPLKPIRKEQQLCIDVLIAWLSITLENMYLSEKLSLKVENLMTESAAASEQTGEHALWFRKTLYQIQEKERRRIASELHDTVMQDIYFARQRISAIRNSASLPAHTDEQLVELSEYLDVINSNLRDANFQLYPHLLREIGFAQTISSLIEDERVHASFQLTLRIEQKTEWDQLDSDTHHHLFRIMQELLSNARKHAGAELVQFHLYYKDNCYVMEYEDDGAGFDIHLEQEGAGLRNIEHRVHSLDGELKLKTAVLQGLKLSLSLHEKMD